MKMLKNGVKSSTMTGMVAAFLVHSLARRTLLSSDLKRKQFYLRQMHRYSRVAFRVLGVELTAVGYDPERFANKNYLMIGNHMSYLDVVLAAAIQPSIFVTSVDMGEAPLLGDIAELAGSIFVERRNRLHVEQDLSVITETLKAGFNVTLYPEGTSTNGQVILPFKKSLLMAAGLAGVDIQPVVLKYLEIDHEPFSKQNADKICWFGKMTFAPHFLGLLSLQSVRAELHFLEPIKVTPESTRGELAEQCHRRISEEYFAGREWLRDPQSFVRTSKLETNPNEEMSVKSAVIN